MKTARLIEIGQMEFEEIEMLPLPQNCVRVKTEMASICGSDLHRIKMGALMDHKLPCPHGYPGHEGIGLVVESNSKLISALMKHLSGRCRVRNLDLIPAPKVEPRRQV